MQGGAQRDAVGPIGDLQLAADLVHIKGVVAGPFHLATVEGDVAVGAVGR